MRRSVRVPTSVDDTRALATPGVRRIVRISPRDNPTELREGVAVIADNYMGGVRGEAGPVCHWSDGESLTATTQSLEAAFRAALDRPGQRIRDDGDVDAAIRSSSRTLDVVYEIPFIAHVPMEPVNYTADVRDDRVELWGPTQDPG